MNNNNSGLFVFLIVCDEVNGNRTFRGLGSTGLPLILHMGPGIEHEAVVCNILELGLVMSL